MVEGHSMFELHKGPYFYYFAFHPFWGIGRQPELARYVKGHYTIEQRFSWISLVKGFSCNKCIAIHVKYVLNCTFAYLVCMTMTCSYVRPSSNPSWR